MDFTLSDEQTKLVEMLDEVGKKNKNSETMDVDVVPAKGVEFSIGPSGNHETLRG